MHDKDATPIEAIDFETLQQSTKRSKESKQNLNSKTILWFAFILLLLCALVVFLILPKYVDEIRNANTVADQTQIETPSFEELPEAIEEIPVSEPLQEPLVELSPEELSALKQEAEALLLQLIEKQNLLESKAVQKWASEEFKIALSLGSNGDEHFRKTEYPRAITAYKDAVTVLDDLELQIAPTLSKHLEKGELALTQAEKDTAIVHFQLAKSIDTNNSQAINGLKRAETIKELYALLDQGGKLEAANRFSNAKTSYQKATELDPLSPEAKAALDRVSNRLTQNEFARLINQGYKSLKARQYGDARAAFTTAQKLSPNSDIAKQGIASVEQAIRSEKLDTLTIEAQYFEDTQNWGNAAKSYEQMLVLLPNSSSAKQGLERSRQRETILTKLAEHIDNKLRLSTENVSNEAKQLLDEIATINNPGSNIEQRAATLKELISIANQPISITLQSDNQTEVAIFKVGKFGKFDQRKVGLKMGKYTIVGSRSGYRDVRKVVTVTAEMPSKTVSISCNEPI